MMSILTALLVVAAVGLIASVLLTLAAHFLHVDEDEKAKQVRECLPGANCGACGFTGCDSYAKALADGDAKANRCVPGGADTAGKLSEILGVAVEAVEAKVAFVRCNGNCEAAPKKMIYDGAHSCKTASMLYGGPNACRFGCLGCGDCAAVCPAHAICMQDGIAHVDSRACMGCGACVSVCPKHLVTLVPRAAKTVVMCSNTEKGAVVRKNCRNACIGCKKCELNCPEKAITVTNNLAAIDYDKCNGCGACVELCPMHCLKMADFSA